MKHAKHALPGNFLALVLLACCKGNGSGIIKPFCRLVRGVWTPSSWETLLPSVCTKYCILSTLLLTLLPGDLTYVLVCGLFLAMKVGPLFTVPWTCFHQLKERFVLLSLESQRNQRRSSDCEGNILS